MKYFYMGMFGLAGVFARYWLNLAVTRHFVMHFPLGTFLINITGSFLIGVAYVLGAEHALLSPDLRLGIAVGFLGGFTTFSSYALETGHLLELGKYAYAAAYFTLSPILGLAAALGGLALTRTLLGPS